MSRPAINSVKLNANLHLSECHPDSETATVNGVKSNTWWLYDDRAYGSGMNISMRAKTRDDALVEGIEFWVERAIAAELKYTELRAVVDAFVSRFPEDQL